MTTELICQLEATPEIACQTEPGPVIQVELVGGGGVSDHSQLSGREQPGQHPIQAIEDLSSELAGRVTQAQTEKIIDQSVIDLSNQEILQLWNSITI